MRRGAVIVEGPLAVRMQRFAAAAAKHVGHDILTLPHLAARLAGGFLSLPGVDVLYPAIRSALAEGGFAQLDEVRALPGMPRAVAHSLASIWRADLDLVVLAPRSSRLADVHLIETRIRSLLPPGKLLPRDLRDTALAHAARAKNLFGVITVEGLVDVDPVWRPLVAAIARDVPVTWVAPDAGDRSWFPGKVLFRELPAAPGIRAYLCAAPRSEVVEALRWVRELLSSGDVAARDIAISSATTESWDDHMLVLSREAGLPVHFSHGIPALSTREGQACAALADVLLKGLSQTGVRRLIRRLAGTPFRDRLPDEWSTGLPASAGLFAVEHWRAALAATPAGANTAPVLLPVLELISQGPIAANEAGAALLNGQSRALWEQALRNAPPEAIEMSLGDLRVPDGLDPANSVVWCPASHSAASPRPWARLLGLTSRSWPRPAAEDPLLPDHMLSHRELEPVSLADRDRRLFDVIRSHASAGLVMSRSRRSALGGLQSASALWPATGEESLARTRIPDHAYSNSDRLLARPLEARDYPQVAAAQSCWKNWRNQDLNAHDGLHGGPHAVVERALERAQSSTSIRRLLRDPLGYVWRYALGWRSPQFEQQPLSLSPLAFGELVHELIRRTVQALNAGPGLNRATPIQIEAALDISVAQVAELWPRERAVPPSLLWQHTLQQGKRLSLRGLTIDGSLHPDTRSWTELSFGVDDGPHPNSVWDSSQRVLVPGTGLHFSGRIDRVDLRADTVTISDYKSGKVPRNPGSIVLARGNELQRVLYALAARQLLPDISKSPSRLLYLAEETAPCVLEGEVLDNAIAEVTGFVVAALQIVRSGATVRGEDAQDKGHDDLRLALPADREAYLRRKQQPFAEANRGLRPLWGRS